MTSEAEAPPFGAQFPDNARPVNLGQMLEQASSTAAPDIDPAPSLDVELICGYIDPGSEALLKQARVRELNGYDEEFMSRRDPAKNPAIYITDLLERGVESIGGVKPSRVVIQQLLAGDRNQLLLAIRKAAYGPEVKFTLTECETCGQGSDIIINIDDPEDVPVIEMPDPLVRAFDVPLRHGTARVTLVNGRIQEAYSENIDKRTPSEMNTVLLSKAVVSIGGLPTNGQEEPIRSLAVADRETLVDFTNDHQYGPQIKEIRVPCSTCGREYPVLLGLGNLFRF